MGIENIEKNVWAVALKDIVFTKANMNGIQVLNMNEEVRNVQISINNEKIVKCLLSLHKRIKEDGSYLFNSINTVMNDIEKIHINRVKDHLIKGLN